MQAVHLRCEYLNNPLGLGTPTPRIMWTVEGGEKQTEFEIAYWLNDQEEVLLSEASSSMHYDFKTPFASRDRIEYRIRLKDETGKRGEWSELASFEIGLLSQEDWKANWIRGDYRAKKNRRYPVDCFQKEFFLPSCSSARLYLSALGLYEAEINGQRVGDFILAPGSTDYRKRVQYQAYDVTPLLKDGRNVIRVQLADGWYRGSIGAKGFTAVFGKETAFLCQLETITDGKRFVALISDESWSWSNDGPLRFADLKDGEIVDFRCSPSYRSFAKIAKAHPFLCASNNVPVREKETFTPLRIFTSKTGKKVYEFPQNLAGYLSFRISGKEGECAHLILGEMLDEAGDVTLKNIQCVRKGKKTPLQEVHVICGKETTTYHGKFMIAGFRYVSLTGNASLEEVQQIALYSDVEETSSFACSHPLIQTFYQNTLWSLKGNSCDVPTDCPTRERMGWTGDSQVFFNAASTLTCYAPFARKHLCDIYDRQKKNGCLPQIAPYNHEDWFMDVMNGSVGWADAGVLIPYRFAKRYGDDRLLESYYPRMKAYAEFMIRRCGRAKGIYSLYAKPLGLSKANRKYGVNTGQSYGEWAEPADVKAFVWTDFAEPHPEESMAYTSYILGLMGEIAKKLGHEEDASRFLAYSEGVKKAYQELVTKPRFSLDTDRQAKLVRPLQFHLLTEEQEAFAKKRLLEALEHYGWRLGTGFLSTPFILPVLAEYDVDAAYRLLLNEEMPGWLYMAKHSTGTIWEGWEGPNSDKGIASLNHYSKGAMVEWLFNGMLGIGIEKENVFSISPVIGEGVEFAEGTYQSIYGKVASSWKKEGDQVRFRFVIPANTTAEFTYGEYKKTFGPGTHECLLPLAK